MVQIKQTEDEIKIVIEMNRLITRKPDVTLLSNYIKFNNPPIFFERHLVQEIDEVASFCRIFKNEARIVLIKKQKGIWPEIFKNLSKEELFKRRLEIADQIVERNKERDQQALIRYEHKRRNEIEKEVKREAAMRERVKQFEETACREALIVGGKETHIKQKEQPAPRVECRAATPVVRPCVRAAGRINVCFSNFAFHTPKRESQEGLARPFTITDNPDPPQTDGTHLENVE